MLPQQRMRHAGGQATQSLTGGIRHVPLVLDLSCLRIVCLLHRRSPFHFTVAGHPACVAPVSIPHFHQTQALRRRRPAGRPGTRRPVLQCPSKHLLRALALTHGNLHKNQPPHHSIQETICRHVGTGARPPPRSPARFEHRPVGVPALARRRPKGSKVVAAEQSASNPCRSPKARRAAKPATPGDPPADAGPARSARRTGSAATRASNRGWKLAADELRLPRSPGRPAGVRSAHRASDRAHAASPGPAPRPAPGRARLHRFGQQAGSGRAFPAQFAGGTLQFRLYGPATGLPLTSSEGSPVVCQGQFVTCHRTLRQVTVVPGSSAACPTTRLLFHQFENDHLRRITQPRAQS